MTKWSKIRSGARVALFASAVPAVMGQAIAQDAPQQSVIGRTYAESVEASWPGAVIARGKPNIIWILLDDVGFGAASAFGGNSNLVHAFITSTSISCPLGGDMVAINPSAFHKFIKSI